MKRGRSNRSIAEGAGMKERGCAKEGHLLIRTNCNAEEWKNQSGRAVPKGQLTEPSEGRSV